MTAGGLISVFELIELTVSSAETFQRVGKPQIVSFVRVEFNCSPVMTAGRIDFAELFSFMEGCCSSRALRELQEGNLSRVFGSSFHAGARCNVPLVKNLRGRVGLFLRAAGHQDCGQGEAAEEESAEVGFPPGKGEADPGDREGGPKEGAQVNRMEIAHSDHIPLQRRSQKKHAQRRREKGVYDSQGSALHHQDGIEDEKEGQDEYRPA